ncbi:MAG: DUF4386 domain-containing protein [Calditrichaceae bacterium]|jgi:hypothetical protein
MNSYKKTARLAGLMYLILIITGIFSLMYVPSKIFVYDDTAATIHNILSYEFLFRMGIVISLISSVFYLILVLTLNSLFKPVNAKLAFSMVTMVVISVAISFVNMLNEAGALILLKSPQIAAAFDQTQIHVLIKLFLDIYGQGDVINGVFWGLWLIPFGILVIKSGFIPKIPGYFLIAGGIGYAAASLTTLLFPDYGNAVTQYATIPADIGEFSMMLWLIIKGVKDQPKTSQVQGGAG